MNDEDTFCVIFKAYGNKYQLEQMLRNALDELKRAKVSEENPEWYVEGAGSGVYHKLTVKKD